jgi:DMSO/TMAO reductase YedYZ molybdopterin-dependent catalytic subunit
MTSITRRCFLEAALLAPSFARQVSSARFVGTVPLGTTGGVTRMPPFGRLLGPGLDARLFTDLSTLSPDKPDTLVTATDRFFVRTAAPAALRAEAWTVSIAGLVSAPSELDLRALETMTVRGGRYLIECSGNVDQSNYGLMSTADWDGVPMATVLGRVRPTTSAHRVLVSGVDHEASLAGTSVPGASWIFSRADLDRALLATRMNGAPLPADHGAPVRLIVPGWYGCACIKWVDRIDVVADEAPATTQMREFAARTHQPFDSREIEGSLRAGRPLLARDFEAAVIDTAAMPVRVEKWTENGRVLYRVFGIIWGGSKPTNALWIRFKSGTPWVHVEHCPLPESTLTWSLWWHTWRPGAPGRYQIVLKVDDPSIRTRRLDVFFYVREITIDEV